jgi:multiple sugar transport system substrate-binding protein
MFEIIEDRKIHLSLLAPHISASDKYARLQLLERLQILTESQKISRRRYLQLTGAAAAGLVVGGALGYVGKPAVTAPAVTETVTETATATQVLTPTTATAAGLPSLAGTKITIAGCSGPLAWTLKRMKDKFEAATGASVTIDEIDYVTLVDKIELDVMSHTGTYDGFNLFYTEFPYMYAGNYLADLDDFIYDPKIADPNADLDKDFLPEIIETCKYNNKWKILPYQPNIRVLTYRADLFKQNGIDPNMNFDTFKAACQTLTDRSKKFYGYVPQGGLYLHALFSFLPFFWGNGAELFDDKWNPTMNSDEGVAAMEYFASLMPYTPPGCATYYAEEADLHLLSNTGAMADLWADHLARMDDPKESKVVGLCEYGIMPAGPAGQYPCRSFWSNAVNADSKNKLATYKFFEWVISKAEVPDFIGTVGIPLRTSALKNPDLAKTNRWFPAILNNYAHSKSVPITIPQYPAIQNVLGLAVNEVMVGKAQPKGALDKAAADVHKIMADAGYYK